jgi:hypothetical protein
MPLTTAPAAGDTYQVYQTSSLEGTHPSQYDSAEIVVGINGNRGFAAFAAQVFVKY